MQEAMTLDRRPMASQIIGNSSVHSKFIQANIKENMKFSGP